MDAASTKYWELFNKTNNLCVCVPVWRELERIAKEQEEKKLEEEMKKLREEELKKKTKKAGKKDTKEVSRKKSLLEGKQVYVFHINTLLCN